SNLFTFALGLILSFSLDSNVFAQQAPSAITNFENAAPVLDNLLSLNPGSAKILDFNSGIGFQIMRANNAGNTGWDVEMEVEKSYDFNSAYLFFSDYPLLVVGLQLQLGRGLY